MPVLGRLLVAMATPFDDAGALDLEGAAVLARHLVDHGCDGILVAGTTGESPTLDHAETLALFEAVVGAVGDRAQVVAGCGKNDTRATVALVADATALGVDAVMLVTPYYSKPSQEGLAAHFRAGAAATDLPVLLYDIAGRTAREIALDTLLDLAEVANVCGVKDASGDLDKASRLLARVDAEAFGLWSGADSWNLPLLALGASGFVSVAGHLVGDELRAMLDLHATDPGKARAIHHRLMPLYDLLFAEPSPGPLKAGLAHLGLPAGGLRLPMTPASADLSTAVRDELDRLGVRPSASTSASAAVTS